MRTNAKLDKTNIPLSGFGVATTDIELGDHKLTDLQSQQIRMMQPKKIM
jgi:hypothetical protein